MFEHLAGAAIVTFAGLMSSVMLIGSGSGILRKSGIFILGALIIQLGLGAGAWLTKLNVPALGWVVSTGSPMSVVVRSMHTIGGMLLFTSSVFASLHVARRFCWQSVSSPLSGESVVTREGLA